MWIRANFVMSLDGAIVGPEGLSRSLGTPADRTVFTLARSLADVVLVGAGTVRAEDYRPSTRPLAIVTRSLDLPASLRLFAERSPEHAVPIVLTTDEAADRAPAWLASAAQVLPCGRGIVDLPTALAALTDRGWTRILCEGGPALLTDLIDAGLVDELLLTIVPVLAGGTDHLVTRSSGFQPPVRLRLAEVLQHDGTVLTRYLTRQLVR